MRILSYGIVTEVGSWGARFDSRRFSPSACVRNMTTRRILGPVGRKSNIPINESDPIEEKHTVVAGDEEFVREREENRAVKPYSSLPHV